MDFVNKAYAQLAELFRSMSAGARIATAALLALVVVSLVYLFQYQVALGDEFLLDGRPFSTSELTQMEAAFAQAGLGQSTIVGNRIRIPRGKKDVYLAALADGNALPANFETYFNEAIAGDTPFSSSKSLEMKRWNAKQKSLALIIGRMRGIEAATVQYDEEVKRGLIHDKQKTAMVAVQSGGRLDGDQVKAIRNIVASAYAGLDRRQITITDMTTGFSYGGAIGPDGMSDDENLYATVKQNYEREWKQKIADQLSMIPGVIVNIYAELTPDVENTASVVKYDPKPVSYATTESNKEATSHSPQIGGRPGALSNAVGGNQSVDIRQTAASGAESTTSESRSTNQLAPGFEQRTLKNATLIPKGATASIDVPSSYYVSVWKQKNPPVEGQPAKKPDPAELALIETQTIEKIKERVRVLLPKLEQGTNPWPHIVVNTYTDLPTASIVPPTLSKAATTWLADNWRTLALVGLGLMSLVMLRSMVRSNTRLPQPAAAAAGEAATPRLAIHEPPPDEDEPEPSRVLKRKFTATGPDLKNELHEIVKENPDAAATILRSWIGEAV